MRGVIMMQRLQIFFVSFITILACILWFFNKTEHVRESITYFPIHPDISFVEAKTEIIPIAKGRIQLRSLSRMAIPVYLRQDVTMLYASGKLISKMGKWEQNGIQLENTEKLRINDNGKLQAVSFHHAEIHEDSTFSSTHAITTDQLYYLQSTVPEALSFKSPATEEQIGWKEVLDKKEAETISSSIETITESFSIDRDHFVIFPLTELRQYQDQPLYTFSATETKQIIGQLIEGIYKNYFLGIKKEDGSVISPINSTIPIIFLAKNKEFLYVSFLTADGEPILLKQNISF